MKITKDLLVDLIFNKNLKIKEVAEYCSVTRKTINNYMKKFDIQTPRRNKNANYSDNELHAILYKMYVIEFKTSTEIAKILNVSSNFVICNMKRLGIHIRERNEYIGKKNWNWKGGKHITSDGYIKIRMPGHHRADVHGYVNEHLLVAEKTLKRKVKWFGLNHPNNEIIHHINGDKQDNRWENLMVISQSKHVKIHRENGDL